MTSQSDIDAGRAPAKTVRQLVSALRQNLSAAGADVSSLKLCLVGRGISNQELPISQVLKLWAAVAPEGGSYREECLRLADRADRAEEALARLSKHIRAADKKTTMAINAAVPDPAPVSLSVQEGQGEGCPWCECPSAQFDGHCCEDFRSSAFRSVRIWGVRDAVQVPNFYEAILSQNGENKPFITLLTSGTPAGMPAEGHGRADYWSLTFQQAADLAEQIQTTIKRVESAGAETGQS